MEAWGGEMACPAFCLLLSFQIHRVWWYIEVSFPWVFRQLGAIKRLIHHVVIMTENLKVHRIIWSERIFRRSHIQLVRLDGQVRTDPVRLSKPLEYGILKTTQSSLFHCRTVLTGKCFFRISSLKLSYFTLDSLSFAPSCSTVKTLTSSPQWPWP